MTSTIRDRVTACVEEMLDRAPFLKPRGPHERARLGAVHTHFDELFGRKMPPEEALTLVDPVFTSFVRAMEARGTPGRPLLTLPLGSASEQLTLAVPADTEGLLRQLDTVEPPAMYISSWDTWINDWTYEHYSCPLPFAVIHSLRDGVVENYMESRSAGRDREFHRTVYCAHYPERFRK